MGPKPPGRSLETNPAPCLQLQEIMREVQDHLMALAELSRAAAIALQNHNENLAREIDLQIELELGAKERSMGKLEQHHKDHGC